MGSTDLLLRATDGVRWAALNNGPAFRAVACSRGAIAERLSMPAAVRAARACDQPGARLPRLCR